MTVLLTKRMIPTSMVISFRCDPPIAFRHWHLL